MMVTNFISGAYFDQLTFVQTIFKNDFEILTITFDLCKN